MPVVSLVSPIPDDSLKKPNRCEQSLLKTSICKSATSSSHQQKIASTRHLRKRKSETISVTEQSRTPVSIVVHPELLPAPDVCEIILQQSQEITSLEVLASITDPVVLRLHECKRAERLNVSQRDEDIDSEDENLYDEPYADIVGND